MLGGTNQRLGSAIEHFTGNPLTSADPMDYVPKSTSPLATLGAAADPVRLLAQCAGVAEA